MKLILFRINLVLALLFFSFPSFALIQNQDITNRTIDHEYIVNSRVTNSIITNSEVVGSSIQNSQLMSDTLRDSVIRQSFGNHIAIERTDIEKSELRNADIRHARIIDSTINGAHLEEFSATNVNIQNMNMMSFGVTNAFLQNGIMTNFNSNNVKIQNGEISGAILNSTLLCSVWSRDEQKLYPPCNNTQEKQIPFVGMYLVYRLGNGGIDNRILTRYDFTGMHDPNTIIVNATVPTYPAYPNTSNVSTGSTNYIQWINLNTRQIVFNTQEGWQNRTVYTELWVPKNLNVNDTVPLGMNPESKVIYEQNGHVFITTNPQMPKNPNEYDKTTGVFFGYSVGLPTARLAENNAL